MTTEATIDKPTAAPVSRAEQTRSGPFYTPAVDICETPEELIVRTDLPGSSPENIEVTFENGTLTLLAKVNARQPEETQFLLREYGVRDYRRAFQVSEIVDAERISAEYTDGVLTLHLPKYEDAKPKRIPISTGDKS